MNVSSFITVRRKNEMNWQLQSYEVFVINSPLPSKSVFTLRPIKTRASNKTTNVITAYTFEAGCNENEKDIFWMDR